MKEESVVLYYKNNESDKVYKASLEKKGKGFVVNFQYGRRNAALTSGTKTNEPVEYSEAVEIYAKLVRSKTSKGYVPDEGGKVFQ